MPGVLIRRVSETGVVYYASALLEGAGVPHAFSTRLGGLSPAPFDSMNLGNPSGCALQDESDRIRANYDRLQAAIGCGERTRCWVHQVHAAGVAVVEPGREFSGEVKADALVGADPDRVLAVRVADCVPVLMATADGTCVAAIHAGWRGVVAGVVPEAIRALRNLGFAQPLLAAIGPCIGYDAFEVGDEVLADFERVFGADAPLRRAGGGKGYVDLREAIRRQLIAGGVEDSRIDTTDRCTYRDHAEFFSHRRERGVTGRMAALIRAVPPQSTRNRAKPQAETDAL